jgi:hypothetical protein
MKKLLFFICLSVLFLVACQKTVDPLTIQNSTVIQPELLRCGMEEAMANLSPEMKNAMARNAKTATAQAGELLIFLDFDGAVVRPGYGSAQGGNVTSPLVNNTKFCPASSLTIKQKAAIIELVKDDFSPFNIKFTTDQSVYDAYSMGNKHVCIVTTLPSVLGFPYFVEGVAPFIGLTFRLSNNPSFVFAGVYGNTFFLETANTISHEIGHTKGLGHHSRYNQDCNYLTEYHQGFGTGPLSFAPIMGSGFGKRIINWFAQPCLIPGYGIPQNDFDFLNNQVELREDDFPNEPGGGSIISSTEITGILEQRDDVDFIRINFTNPGPVTINSENIDIKASLYLPNGQLIAEYENPDDTNITIPAINGLKHLKIEAISNVNLSSVFMTGEYKITH